MYTTKINTTYNQDMYSIFFHLFFTILVAGLLLGCGSSRTIWPDYGSLDKELVRTQPRKAPDWVNDSRVLWYDNRAEAFYVVGRSLDGRDLMLTEAESKAAAARNIAEKIQTLFASRLSGGREGIGNDEIERYSRLILSMVTQRVPLSIATTEMYYEEYRTPRGLHYNVHTLNRVSESSFRFAVSEVIRRLGSEPDSEALKDLLDVLEEELIKGLK